MPIKWRKRWIMSHQPRAYCRTTAIYGKNGGRIPKVAVRRWRPLADQQSSNKTSAHFDGVLSVPGRVKALRLLTKPRQGRGRGGLRWGGCQRHLAAARSDETDTGRCDISEVEVGIETCSLNNETKLKRSKKKKKEESGNKWGEPVEAINHSRPERAN